MPTSKLEQPAQQPTSGCGLCGQHCVPMEHQQQRAGICTLTQRAVHGFHPAHRLCTSAAPLFGGLGMPAASSSASMFSFSTPSSTPAFGSLFGGGSAAAASPLGGQNNQQLQPFQAAQAQSAPAQYPAGADLMQGPVSTNLPYVHAILPTQVLVCLCSLARLWTGMPSCHKALPDPRGAC